MKYNRMDAADASLVVLSEIHRRVKIITTDHRDFSQLWCRHRGTSVVSVPGPWRHVSKPQRESDHGTMGDGIDEETAIGVIHAKSTVADKGGDRVGETVANGGVDLPDQIRTHTKAADVAAAMEKPAVVDFPDSVQADDGIDP